MKGILSEKGKKERIPINPGQESGLLPDGGGMRERPLSENTSSTRRVISPCRKREQKFLLPTGGKVKPQDGRE